jgi:iron complex transport system ATP-binding protein
MPMSHHPVLQVDNLTLTAGEQLLVRNLQWQVDAGQLWCVIGKNGAGKSTLLQAIAGLTAPERGQIFAYGQDVATLSAKHQAQWRGLLQQTQIDVFATTVEDTVLTGRYPYQTGWGWENSDDIALVQRVLVQVGLAGYANKNILHLSGGERQRVAMATLLVQQPALYLLDEPTSHQDVAAQLMMMQIIREIATDHAVVAVCHDLNLVARYASHVLMVADGKYMAGTVQDVLTPTNLETVFDCRFDMLEAADGPVYLPVHRV